jgi:hypothetical protein
VAPLPPYVGAYRTEKPPACRLSHADLERPFRLLDGKARQATDAAVTKFLATLEPHHDRGQAEAYIREVLKLRAQVDGTNGQQRYGVTDAEGLSEESIGFPLRRVTFDSAGALKLRTGNSPDNWVWTDVSVIRRSG